MFLSKHFKLHYWPALSSGWFVLTFIITYFVSVFDGHVYPFFPFISDTGASPPESCIFSQMLNIGAVLLLVTFYIRYRQVEFAIASGNIELRRIWNTMAFWGGLMMSIGLSITGNFQETNLISVHLVGTTTAFGVGSLTLIANTRITFAFKSFYSKHLEYGIGEGIIYFRTFLTICYFILIVAVTICGSMAMNQFTGSDMTWWTEEHGGFKFRLVATVSEWLVALTLLSYVYSATKEFKAMEYEEIRFKSKYVNAITETV